ncbi:MAG: hypothetical protein J6S67_17730 [Methanobrevibacter sp.]|nr:hypothetical protein [Methanobrevibacter sp.]
MESWERPKMKWETMHDCSHEEIVKSANEQIRLYAGVDVMILHRFTLVSSSSGWNDYMKVWDNYTGQYIRDPEHKRELLKFQNSVKAIEYLREKYRDKDSEYLLLRKKPDSEFSYIDMVEGDEYFIRILKKEKGDEK